MGYGRHGYLCRGIPESGHAHTYTNGNTYADSNCDTDTYADANIFANANTIAGTFADINTFANASPDTYTDAHADAETHAQTDAIADPNAGADPETNADASTIAHAIADADPETNADASTIADADTVADWGRSLPGGKVGAPYSGPLNISGGKPPYTSTVSSGALPNGLSLGSASGTISGIPTNRGTSSFTVKVVDSASASVAKGMSISIK